MENTVKSNNKGETKPITIRTIYDKEYWNTHLKWTFQNL